MPSLPELWGKEAEFLSVKDRGKVKNFLTELQNGVDSNPEEKEDYVRKLNEAKDALSRYDTAKNSGDRGQGIYKIITGVDTSFDIRTQIEVYRISIEAKDMELSLQKAELNESQLSANKAEMLQYKERLEMTKRMTWVDHYKETIALVDKNIQEITRQIDQQKESKQLLIQLNALKIDKSLTKAKLSEDDKTALRKQWEGMSNLRVKAEKLSKEAGKNLNQQSKQDLESIREAALAMEKRLIGLGIVKPALSKEQINEKKSSKSMVSKLYQKYKVSKLESLLNELESKMENYGKGMEAKNRNNFLNKFAEMTRLCRDLEKGGVNVEAKARAEWIRDTIKEKAKKEGLVATKIEEIKPKLR